MVNGSKLQQKDFIDTTINKLQRRVNQQITLRDPNSHIVRLPDLTLSSSNHTHSFFFLFFFFYFTFIFFYFTFFSFFFFFSIYALHPPLPFFSFFSYPLFLFFYSVITVIYVHFLSFFFLSFSPAFYLGFKNEKKIKTPSSFSHFSQNFQYFFIIF